MNLLDIIETGLLQEGFDGLVCSGVCGCKSDNLSPGSCLTEECEPAYKHVHSKTGQWVMSTTKKLSDEEIEAVILECC